MQEVIAFKECRIRQPDNQTIKVEIGGREHLTADEQRSLRELATSGEVKGDMTTLEDFNVISKLTESEEA